MAEIILTDQNFQDEVIKSNVPVLVDFWAAWCGPCKILGPIIEKIAEDYEDKKVKICKLNVDENQQTAGQFGIMSIPTILFFKNGKVEAQMVGLQTADTLKHKLDELI